ncbi:thy-1 membrane glycoprotein [Pimephales promelas]|nr:thy-1 membrane glycoprotein [Pimephales promelas]
MSSPPLTVDYLVSHFGLKDRGFDSSQMQAIEEVLHRNLSVFSKGDNDLGRTHLALHKIDTGSAPPVKVPPRRVPLHLQQEVVEQIKQMQENGIIRPSCSPWAAPVVLVKKKDGSLRFCVDYRKLNDVTRKDAYPLPRIDDALDSLTNACWFSTLDLVSGYWQVEVDPQDRPKTAFITRQGLFEFNVLSFGLCNSPSTFQRLMDVVLADLQWTTCLVYLDDIIVFGRTFQEHLQRLEEVLLKLRHAKLKVKPSKCTIFSSQVQYLGHVISAEGVMADPSKVEAVQAWPTPKTQTEVRSFVGLASYYRRFIKGFAEIARPLHQLTEKGKRFVWREECQEAFQQLKSRLISAPVLAYPDPKKPFILDTDASDVGVGAVLSQEDGGLERVVAYASRALTKQERKYATTKKELLSVVTFTKHFKHYLLGREFLLRTDHSSLRWLHNFSGLEGQLARWLEQLANFQYKIIHRPGKQHTNADALSRLPGSGSRGSREDCGNVPPSRVPVTVVRAVREAEGMGGPIRDLPESEDELVKAQQEDPNIQLLINLKNGSVDDGREGERNPALVSYSPVWDQLHMRNQRLVRIPPANSDAASAVQAHGKAPCAPLQMSVVSRPYERVAVDVLGPLPETLNKNKYILIIGDYFSKWTEAFPLPNQEAQSIARVLVEEWVCRYGVPRSLHSDQGRNFESGLFKELCRLLQINKSRTSPYRPQSDGLIERFNRTLLSMLSLFVDENQMNWDRLLPYVMMAYRSSVQASTGFTPYKVLFGQEMVLPVDIMLGVDNMQKFQSVNEYVTGIAESLSTVVEAVKRHQSQASQRQKIHADFRANFHYYVVESMGRDNQRTPVDQTAGRHPESQSLAEGQDFIWGYHPPAAPEAVQTRERAAASSIERNPLVKSAVGGGPPRGNLNLVPGDAGLGERQPESGDQRVEVGDSRPEPCPRRMQPARSRRPPAWSKDYNLT